MSSFLTREQILNAQDLKTEKVTIEEWGGDVIVRTITAKERDNFEKQLVQDGKTNLENIRAKFVAATLVDEDGNLIFTDEDIIELGKKSAAALDKIFDVGQRLAGLRQKDVDELVKN